MTDLRTRLMALGQRLADHCNDLEPEDDGFSYQLGFTACLELLYPCVEALEAWRKYAGYDHLDGMPKPPSHNECESLTYVAFDNLKKALGDSE